MKLEDLIQLIPKKTERYVNQSVLAEALGITRQTVSNRIKNDSKVTVSELKKIEEYFGVTLFNDDTVLGDNVIHIDYYSDVFASCGSGSIVFSSD